MSPRVAIGTKVVNGVTVRDDPAREPCFRLVHLHAEVPDTPAGNQVSCEKLHAEVNQEIQTIEIAALCLADFPDAPWELRMELARQCFDETRHTRLFYRRLLELGGWKGQFVIANLDWSVVAMIDTLPGRLAVQHRTFEAGSLDLQTKGIAVWHELGDHTTAELLEAVEADEIPHVRFANTWLKRLSDADPRTVLQIAAAMAWLRKVVMATGGETVHHIATDGTTRQAAGFSTDEVAEVTRQEQQLVGSMAQAPNGEPHE
ncbi:MAG TPA: DUF455 family protein [Chloroflexota bacterium]|jgi:uncharacterized ferritin-like protein (DUF455 family)